MRELLVLMPISSNLQLIIHCFKNDFRCVSTHSISLVIVEILYIVFGWFENNGQINRVLVTIEELSGKRKTRVLGIGLYFLTFVAFVFTVLSLPTQVGSVLPLYRSYNFDLSVIPIIEINRTQD